MAHYTRTDNQEVEVKAINEWKETNQEAGEYLEKIKDDIILPANNAERLNEKVTCTHGTLVYTVSKSSG